MRARVGIQDTQRHQSIDGIANLLCIADTDRTDAFSIARLAAESFAICAGCEVTILDIGEPLLDVLVAGGREREVGESEKRAALEDSDCIEMARCNRHLRTRKPGANLHDADSVLFSIAIVLKESGNEFHFHSGCYHLSLW